MEFIWNDGGRAVSGYVGTTGDCVTRAIAIATGRAYREVYAELGQRAACSPRDGIPIDVVAEYLLSRGWQAADSEDQDILGKAALPDGVVILYIRAGERRSSHLVTVIDRVLYDTWNPADDQSYTIIKSWRPPQTGYTNPLPARAPKRAISQQQERTQQEFDKALRRLKALDRTANNAASTDAEKRNAVRMMQSIMLENDLTRDDILEGNNADAISFTRMSCAVNGRRAYGWEKSLASYLCEEVFPMVQWYMSPRGHRTIFIFYGPLADVQNTIALLRELLVTIAAAARLQYGSYTSGSGASFAEGWVRGMRDPEPQSTASPTVNPSTPQDSALISARILAVHDAAGEWLRQECHIRLSSSRGRGRSVHDPAAQRRGEIQGAQNKVAAPNAPKRLTQR